MSSKIKEYFVESWRELLRVTWPTKNRAINICVLVVCFVVISAAAIAGVDFLFHQGYSWLLRFSRNLPQ